VQRGLHLRSTRAGGAAGGGLRPWDAELRAGSVGARLQHGYSVARAVGARCLHGCVWCAEGASDGFWGGVQVGEARAAAAAELVRRAQLHLPQVRGSLRRNV
jgi:hypothetical protein